MALIHNKTENTQIVQNLHLGGSTIVIPMGVSEINDLTWGQIRAQFLDKIKAGKIVEISVTVAKEPEAVAANLPPTTPPVHKVTEAAKFGKLPIITAVELVTETFDLAQLESWKSAENRDAVIKAINDQMDKINGKSKED